MVARIESVGKGIPFEAIEKVRSALEKEGIDFFPATTTHGPAIALRKGAQKKSAESA